MATIKRTPVDGIEHTTGKESSNPGAQYLQWSPSYPGMENAELAADMKAFAEWARAKADEEKALKAALIAKAREIYVIAEAVPLNLYNGKFSTPANEKARDGRKKKRTAIEDKPRVSTAELLARFQPKT